MRILVTGVSGMLGSSLALELSKKHSVFGTGNSEISLPIDYRIFDLSNESYKELIDWSQPELIIHCAAVTNGNYCQNNPLEAFNINGCTTKKLMDATEDHVKIIYISTDAVFPSLLHLARETDCVYPENIYGKSKELGEFFLKTSINRDYTIIRTTIVGLNINKQKYGFVEWIINTAKKNKNIELFTDVLFTPISIWDLVKEIRFLVESNNINSEILHIGGELCTKYQFGEKLLRGLNILTNKLKETSILSFTDRASRCKDQSMDSNFYKKKYDRVLPNLNQTISIIKKHYYEQN